MKLCLIALMLLTAAPGRAAEPQTHEWRTARPEEEGFDSSTLAEMFDFVREKKVAVHSVQIVRHGRLILDAYFYPYAAGTRHDVASVTKSITSTLVGLAMDRGLLELRQPVLRYFPGSRVAELNPRKQQVTLEDLLTMRAGWDCGFEPKEMRLFEMRRSADWIEFMLNLPMIAEPGTRWAYCSGNCHVLSAILTRVTGTNALAFARRELFAPLGIQDVVWPADSRGNNHGWGDLQLHPLDMARIGQLFLQRGRWNNRQLLSETWIQKATAAHAARTSNQDQYGYFWWVKGRDFPGMFEALGRGGQRINVWPAKNLVLVFTGGGFEPGDLAPFILKALKSNDPLPANATGFAQLQERRRLASQPPTPRAVSKTPAMARRIAGKTFNLETNGLNLTGLSLAFDEAAEGREARAQFWWEGTAVAFPLGLDGLERFTMNPLTRLRQGATGQWLDDDTFLLTVDLIGGVNFYQLKLTFSPDARQVRVKAGERTGLNEEFFVGVAAR